MALGLFEIDKAGDDTLTKNYSVAIVFNREKVYGFRVPKKIQEDLKNKFDKGELNIQGRFRFILRFHISIIILLIKEIIKENKGLERYKIEICNDYDRHFHEIKDMVFKNLNQEMKNLKKEDITSARFEKSSLVNQAAHKFFKREEKESKNYKFCNLTLEDLIKLIKKQ